MYIQSYPQSYPPNSGTTFLGFILKPSNIRCVGICMLVMRCVLSCATKDQSSDGLLCKISTYFSIMKSICRC